MNGLSLFSGIGGMDLGLERAGITTVGQVEIDPWCRRVLAKHWPDVPRHDDVRTATAWWLGQERPYVDLVFGGFPCQDISNAGRRAGIGGERSGLWSEFHGLIRLLRPRWVLLENVAAILGRGAGRVLGDLAEIGYDAEWDCVPAAAVGAPHRRDRWFAIAYPSGVGLGQGRAWGSAGHRPYREAFGAEALAYAYDGGRYGRPGIVREAGRPEPEDGSGPVGDWWAVEPDVGRVAHGIPGRVDRLRGLGNAVVPQVVEHVGRLIVAADEGRAA